MFLGMQDFILFKSNQINPNLITLVQISPQFFPIELNMPKFNQFCPKKSC